MRTRGWVFTMSLMLFMASQAHAAYFRGLGDTTDSIIEDKAYEISADGAVVVGCGEGLYVDEAFRWTLMGGLEGLGILHAGDTSCALGVSADGSTIVGYSASGSEGEAFRWTQASGMVGLGDLPGGAFRSTARGVSGDGAVVVGVGHTDFGNEAFIWIHGALYNLRTWLIDSLHLDLSGWTLTEARRISADGSTIIGYGINPDGESEAWVVHIGAKTSAPVLAPPTGLHIVAD